VRPAAIFIFRSFLTNTWHFPHLAEKGNHKKAVGRLRGQFVTKTVSRATEEDDFPGPDLPLDIAASHEYILIRNLHRCGSAIDDPRIGRRYIPVMIRGKRSLILCHRLQLSATRPVSDFHKSKRSSWSTRRYSYQSSSACYSSSISLLS